jgi:hypothetical protein
MLTRFCNRINWTLWVLTGALAFLLCLPAWASKKDDDYKAAQAAAAAGQNEDAMKLYCAVAKEDPNYKDAKQNCDNIKTELLKEEGRNEGRYSDGVKAFDAGDYDLAEQKFRNVRSGQYLAEAQNYLNVKIPQARKDAAARAAAQQSSNEAAMNGRFDQAVQAYNGNNFSSAQGQFSQVTGKHQADAQAYLNKIQQYNQAMQDGDNHAGNKDYKSAIDGYNQAIGIKSDGPGNPQGKISQMRSLLASSNNPPPVNNNPTPTPTPHVVAAIVEPARPKLDVDKLLSEADTARNKGDIGTAKGKYMAILAENPGNARAKAGLDSLPKDSNVVASADADRMLANGIGEFYKGAYEDAEVHIKDYIELNGAKAALAYFYRAASKLTRYYLRGEKQDDRKLFTDAESDFRMSKKTPGFNPPDKMVSPKIMDVFRKTT